MVNSWVRVFADATAVETAASSFAKGSGVDSAKIATAAGNKVGIRAFDAATELYTVWVPRLWTTSNTDADREIQLPGDVLAMSERQACLLPAGSATAPSGQDVARLSATTGLIYDN